MAVGISETLVADGLIVRERFAECVRHQKPVGTCDCGGFLDGKIEFTRRVVFFVTTCRSCSAEKVSPGGRLATPTRVRPGELREVDPLKAAEWAAIYRTRLGERDDDEVYATAV